MESDQYMPEYWPATRIIGKLEKALVKAENILGLIQSTQIANLAAAKVTGLLTSAQIAEIEAAKIGGKLTNAQIESIEAAKVTGQIVETQIGPESISTGKIKAANITTALLAVGSATAEKLAVNSVIAEKLAVNAVTASKIAVGAVIAEKISVAELSAIAANLGSINAGTITGATFRTSASEELLINGASGMSIKGAELASEQRRITFKRSDDASIMGTITPVRDATGTKTSNILGIGVRSPAGFNEAFIEMKSFNAAAGGFIRVGASGAALTITNDAEESSFPQLTELAKRTLNLKGGNVTLRGTGDISDFPKLTEPVKRVIIGGRVKANGEKESGDAGFTCKRNAKGDFTVEFTTEFTIVPSVYAIPISEAFIPNFILSEVTKKKFRFKIWNVGVAEDSIFTFLAYG
jgi:hypothetical protein